MKYATIDSCLGHPSEAGSIWLVPSSGGTPGSASGDRGSWPEDEAPASTEMSAGKGADAWGEIAVPGARTRCFFQESVWLRSDRPTTKVAGEGLTAAALTDVSMASGIVLPAAPAGAAPGAAGALGLRGVCRDGAVGTVVAATADCAALVQRGGAAAGARDWRAGAAGVGGGGCTRGASAAARDESGRDERSAIAACEVAASLQSRARCPIL